MAPPAACNRSLRRAAQLLAPGRRSLLAAPPRVALAEAPVAEDEVLNKAL
jgi:hypothetical protein